MSARKLNPYWLGIDLGQKSVVASLAPQGLTPDRWRELPVASFSFDAAGLKALRAWLRQQLKGAGRLAGAVVEATGGLALDLAALWREQVALSIVNPRRPRELARSAGVRDKNDAIDAALIATYGAIYQPAPTNLLSPAMSRLRALSRMRQSLQEELTCWSSRLSQQREAYTRALCERFKLQLQRELKRLDEELKALLAQAPELAQPIKLLKSIPGIGPVVATVLVAELGDLRQYSREQVVAAAGLYPRQHSSAGRALKRPRLAKGGGSRVRRALFLSALGLCKQHGPLAVFGLNLRNHGKHGRSALVAMMRKQLLVARAVLRSGSAYQPTHAQRRHGLRRNSTGFQSIGEILENTKFIH